MEQIKQWYSSLEQNEQKIVIIAGVFFALIILFFVLIKPLNDSVSNLEIQVESRESSVETWKQAMPQLLAAGGQVKGSNNQALSTVVTSTTRRFNLRVSRVKENGLSEMQVWFDNVPFNDFVRWASELETKYQITIASVNIRSKDRDGLTSMDIKIQRS